MATERIPGERLLLQRRDKQLSDIRADTVDVDLTSSAKFPKKVVQVCPGRSL